jgi:hypothetical protein
VGCCRKKKGINWLVYRCICDFKPDYYGHCKQGQLSADSIETSVWNEVGKILRYPTLVIAELKRKQSKPARASLEAEKILFENRLKQLLVEEQRYLRLYGRGDVEESLLLVEIDRIKRERRSVEQRRGVR